jgi:translocation and assembly module TamA
MRRALAPLLACVAVIGSSGCAVPRGTAERPSITSFRIRGTEALDEADIKEKLATQPSEPWWELFWRDASYFDEDAFAADRKRVERFYQAEGYYQARVVEAGAEPDGEGRVKVQMRVEEGRPTRVVELRIEGLDEAPEARARLEGRGRLPLREGRIFTEAAFDETRRAIVEALGETGYPRGEVTQQANVLPELGEARVVYTVRPGQRFRFGSVFVSGTAAIPRVRLREEAEAVFRPGQWFDTTDLPKLQSRVFDLGVFGGVRVSQGPADEKRGTIPIVLSVREAPFRTIRVGPGVGIELNRYEAHVMVGWAHRNWLGGLRRLSLDARLGYAWIPSLWSRQQEGFVGLASAEFTQPGVIRRRVDFTTRLELERGIEEAYSFWSERIRVGAPMRFGRVLTFSPSYNLELYQVTGTVNLTPGENTDENALLQSCRGDSCLLSYFEQRITLDLRDDPINTRRGLYLSLGVQEGFKLFGEGFPYLRLLPEARGFVPVWRDSVLAARFRIGLLRSLDENDPPVVARFYGGGPNLMRGYYTRRLSPMVRDEDDGDFVPVGGEGLVDGSVELRTPIAGNLGGAVFLDFGNTTVQAGDVLDLGELQYAAGLGIRYNTPFGPLRFDVAARLPRRTAEGWDQPGVPVLVSDPTGALVDSGERRKEPIVSVHLSLGQAF